MTTCGYQATVACPQLKARAGEEEKFLPQR